MLEPSTPSGDRHSLIDQTPSHLPDKYPWRETAQGGAAAGPDGLENAARCVETVLHPLTFTDGSSVRQVEPAWYCLRSQPKHEHIAAAHVRRLECVDVFCPRIRFKRSTSQGQVWVTEAMFPGYLFARFDLAQMHRQVQYAPGIRVIIRFGERYPTIDEATIAQLREHTGDTGIKVVTYDLTAGDQVKVVDGAFAGLEAVVTQVLPAGQRIKILMDFLGRRIEAEINVGSIVPQTVNLA